MEQECNLEAARRLRRPILFGADENAERDAYAMTLEYRESSRIPLDAGKQPIAESPLFGGTAQLGLWV